MKKTLLGLLAVATISLASCGEKLLTDAEVQAEITKGIEAGKAAIISEETANCDANFDARVEEAVQVKMAEMESAKASEVQ